MFGSVARLITAATLGAAVAGSLSITHYLTALEEGIEQNVVAARAPVEAQKAIRDRNAVLGEMVAATNRISVGLDGALEQSVAIRGHVGAVGEANRATLGLNRSMAGHNEAAATDLEGVIAGLRSMNGSAAAIREYLRELRSVAAADVDYLESIAVSTARMNAKTEFLGR